MAIERRKYRSFEDRAAGFFKFISPEPNTGCWFWLGNHSPNGYAMFASTKGRLAGAHRFSYLIHKGEIPAGLEIDHMCNMKGCVNPDHLRAVTSRVNQLRTNSVVAQNARKTHCKHGHEFSVENTVVHSGGGRECWTCRKAFKRKYYLQRRAKAMLVNPHREVQDA